MNIPELVGNFERIASWKPAIVTFIAYAIDAALPRLASAFGDLSKAASGGSSVVGLIVELVKTACR